MIYRQNDVDKMQEECGVFGIYAPGENVALSTYWGLYALQHRGQESAGIVVSNGDQIDVKRGLGLVNEVFRQGLPELAGHMALGHVQYAIAGSNLLCNVQPLSGAYAGGQISLAQNGNLTNADALRAQLKQQGSVFHTTTDTEVIINLLARSTQASIEQKIAESISCLAGAYCLAIMAEGKLIGVRDPHGFRPLCIGKLDDGWVLASETCALDVVGAEFYRDVQPGEMVVIDNNGPKITQVMAKAEQALCIFEYIYFARPDSVIDGQSVHEARLLMGRELAKETGLTGDIVISVPDSGTTAAVGFSHESGIPFAEGLIKNRYIGRTFIQPEQKMRDLSVKIKLNPVASLLRGKSVIMIDDSIVRGTTSGQIVRLLKEAGAKAVHMCVSSPTITYPCYFGIDTSTRKDLIAVSKTPEEIRQYIGADSLHFLSLPGLKRSVPNLVADNLCYACFNGTYPKTTSKCKQCFGQCN